MASFSLLPGNITPQSLPPLNLGGGNSSGSTGNSADQMREVSLGQIISNLVIKAVLNFDDPVTTSSQGQSPSNQSGFQQNQQSQSTQNNNQVAASGALTKEGGLSYGGGVRIGGAGVGGSGLSAVGTTTVNGDGYQTSGGISVGGISANAGVKISGSGVSFTGGIQKAQVGQGIVGPLVGPKIVGP